MATTTGIQWTDHTFNPWIGCTKISTGCLNCYAEVEQFVRVQRSRARELWGPHAARHITSHKYWKDPVKWNAQAKEEGRRHRVFCASLADVFEDRRDLDQPRMQLAALVKDTPRLDWQLLTKRPEQMRRLMPIAWEHHGWPCNVWAMTSVENQEYAERRIPELLQVPARTRGLSVEPLLGPVSLCSCQSHITPVGWHTPQCWLSQIHWVIIGGESGSHARPCHVEWVRDLVQQCRDAGVACFVKQLGSKISWNDANGKWMALEHHKGGDPAEWPDDLRVRQFPGG